MEYLLVVCAVFLILGVCEGIREAIERRLADPDWSREYMGPQR